MVALLIILSLLGFAAFTFISVLRIIQHRRQIENIRREESGYSSNRRGYGYDDEKPKTPKEPITMPARKPIWWSMAAAIFCFVLFIIISWGGGVQVGATQVAIIENTASGQFYSINSGTHIWPFSSRVTPFVTHITKYDTRYQKVEIGNGDDIRVNGIAASSNSPGTPVVYYHLSMLVRPNPDQIIELHRLYGEKYVDTLVKNTWIEVLKEIQGKNTFDYIIDNREELVTKVQEELQNRLKTSDGQSLIFIDEMNIVNYDYDDKTNAYLDSINQKANELALAQQQKGVNEAQQESAKVQAETDYLIQQRAADAEAYAVTAQASAEATAIQTVRDAIASTGLSYKEYLIYTTWNGQLPYSTGSGAIPFFELPTITDTE